MQGMFNNTNYGAYATASTVTSSLTFSLSPNSTSMGRLAARLGNHQFQFKLRYHNQSGIRRSNIHLWSE